jgi:uncharacterized membrane protein YGL010W
MTRWVFIAPLIFAALLLAHPMGEGDLYAVASRDVTRWLVVHCGAAVLFPVMAGVVWWLLRDVRASVARGALLVFAVFYTAWEVMTGIATGVLAAEGEAASVRHLSTSWISGELGMFNSVGALAWTVAIAGAVLALRRAGASRGPLVALGLSALMVMHVPPIGPFALVCLAGAAVSLQRMKVA